jgi:hypothetical protein
MLGTAAALLHCEHKLPLSEAVSQVVKKIDLTTHHLRRIIEAANVKAYLSEYDKQSDCVGDGHWIRYVSFCGGPALFDNVMDMLDACRTEEEAVMPSSDDYTVEPQNYKAAKYVADFPEVEKVASEEMPKVSLDRLHSDLGTAITKVEDQLLRLTNLEPELKEAFLKDAKQAVMRDYTLGDIRKVASDSPDVDLDRSLNELAYSMKSVFWDDNDIMKSFEKVSNFKPVPNHPLTHKFAAWKEAKNQLETANATRKVLMEKRAEVLKAIKEVRDA